MNQRGRKSAASLAVVTSMPEHRPAPPEELSTEEVEEWRAIVSRMPADWFPRECHAQLVNYCRHVVKARMIDGLVKGFQLEWAGTDEGLHRLDKLTHMAERESRAIASIGTKLKITLQSRYARAENAHVALKKAASSKPWEKFA